MPLVTANGVGIEVERHGPETGETVLLIMGLAGQLVHWPRAFIENLGASGRRVVAIDNRDVGLSQKFHEKRALSPVVVGAIAPALRAFKLAPYTLEDMAKDSVGVLDAIGAERAHVVGVSMGGMIGQVMAASAPSRVLSLTAIMSNTNNPRLPRPNRAVLEALFKPVPKAKSRDELIERALAKWDLIGSADGGNDPIEFRARIARAIDRCEYPAGVRRQIAAIVATGDLRRFARKVSAPTLVIHGSKDPLAPPAGGEDIAANVPGARLEIIDGMGHDMPPRYLPKITELVLAHLAANGDARKKNAA
jgi:pimeloyl-ACP methyl ester carboxylesterase